MVSLNFDKANVVSNGKTNDVNLRNSSQGDNEKVDLPIMWHQSHVADPLPKPDKMERSGNPLFAPSSEIGLGKKPSRNYAVPPKIIKMYKEDHCSGFASSERKIIRYEKQLESIINDRKLHQAEGVPMARISFRGSELKALFRSISGLKQKLERDTRCNDTQKGSIMLKMDELHRKAQREVSLYPLWNQFQRLQREFDSSRKEIAHVRYRSNWLDAKRANLVWSFWKLETAAVRFINHLRDCRDGVTSKLADNIESDLLSRAHWAVDRFWLAVFEEAQVTEATEHQGSSGYRHINITLPVDDRDPQKLAKYGFRLNEDGTTLTRTGLKLPLKEMK
jgi:hypothetical protein